METLEEFIEKYYLGHPERISKKEEIERILRENPKHAGLLLSGMFSNLPEFRKRCDYQVEKDRLEAAERILKSIGIT